MKYRAFQVGLAALLVVFAFGCMDPKDRRPGLSLSGEVVNEPINDWSFADEIQQIYLETQTWYLIPHSVTTVCAGLGEKLYVPSIYYGAESGQISTGTRTCPPIRECVSRWTARSTSARQSWSRTQRSSRPPFRHLPPSTPSGKKCWRSQRASAPTCPLCAWIRAAVEKTTTNPGPNVDGLREN